MPMQGRLIVLEGPSGVGKSALAGKLRDALERRGVSAEILALPAAGKADGLGRQDHQFHRDPTAPVVGPTPPSTPYLPHLNARTDAIAGDALTRISAGTWVILDRFWWTTWVDGVLAEAEGQALEVLIATARSEWDKVAPTPAFLVRRPSPIGEAELPVNWDKMAAAYDEIAFAERSRHPVVIIDNIGTIDVAVAQMLAAIGGIRFRSRTVQPRSSARIKRGIRRPSIGAMDLFAAPGHAAAAQDALPPGFNGTRDLPSAGIPAVLCPMAPAKPSPVYETYWRFAAERQSIFFRKIDGEAPLTEDPILAEYKFTNAYRASDRTSQYLIREVLYAHDASPVEAFFRVMLFKLFNKIETWELLKGEVGVPRWEDYDFRRYARVLETAMQAGQRIYSAAYIMPSGSGDFEDRRKHISHLKLLERMMRDELPLRVAECRTMRRAFELIRSYPMIGDFLAYQYVTDVNYGPTTDFDEMEFIVPGPGARDGIRKCFTSLGGLTEANLIRWIAERQQEEFERFGIAFRSLWGRPLQLIDCQNLFCEVDKYARQAHPDIRGLSGRTKIKQTYRPRTDAIAFWYPPRWGINELIEAGDR
jgi:hypothetical protein